MTKHKFLNEAISLLDQTGMGGVREKHYVPEKFKSLRETKLSSSYSPFAKHEKKIIGNKSDLGNYIV